MQNKNRTDQKSFWATGYLEWSDEEFKERFGLNGANFEFILNRVPAMIVKQPTNMIPNPTEEHRRLALTIYKLATNGHFTSVKFSWYVPVTGNRMFQQNYKGYGALLKLHSQRKNG